MKTIILLLLATAVFADTHKIVDHLATVSQTQGHRQNDDLSQCFHKHPEVLSTLSHLISDFNLNLVHLSPLNFANQTTSALQTLPVPFRACILRSKTFKTILQNLQLSNGVKTLWRRFYLNTLGNIEQVYALRTELINHPENGDEIIGNLLKIILASNPREEKMTNDDPMVILTTGLNAMAAGLGLPPVSDCLPCFQNSNPQGWVDFIGEALDRASRLSIFNIGSFVTYMNNFINNLPEDTMNCFINSQDLIGLENHYNIAGMTQEQISNKMTGNAIGNLFTVLRDEKIVNNDWKAANYAQAGTDGDVLLNILLK